MSLRNEIAKSQKTFKMEKNFEVLQLYKYMKDGYLVVTTEKPGPMVDYKNAWYRLVASDGYLLTNDNEHFYKIKDIDKTELSTWYEITDTSEGGP